MNDQHNGGDTLAGSATGKPSNNDGRWVSAPALSWVIHDAPVPADLAWTLTVIASCCDAWGCGSRQSIATIAERTGKSPAQVRRDIRRLLQLGLIRLGDQHLVDHLPPGQRPVVYDVAMELRGPKPAKASRNRSGRAKGTPGTSGMDATPCMDARGAEGVDVSAGQSVAGVGTPGMDATPGMHATPRMDAQGTPGMDARGTPCMDARGPLASMPPEKEEKNPKKNPKKNPLSDPLVTIMNVVGASAEEAREIINLINKEREPHNPARYIHTIAANGDLPYWLHRVRTGNTNPARPHLHVVTRGHQPFKITTSPDAYANGF